MHSEAVPAPSSGIPIAPRWVNRLLLGFAIYAVAGMAWILSGYGGPQNIQYVVLFCKMPAELATAIVTAATARRMERHALRLAWRFLTIALALYFSADCIADAYLLAGRDPFPSPADILYLAFYLPLVAGALWLIRAAAVRVPWIQLSFDAAIFVVGFGAFFWFLVIQPAAMHVQLGLLKETLSEAYLGLDCFSLLLLGVLLLTGASNIGGRRIPLLLLAGFGIMFLGDIVWSLAKVRGSYFLGGFQDVLYLACFLPIAAAGREQIRAVAAPIRDPSGAPDPLSRSLPYAAMAVAFLVLGHLSRGDVGGSATAMTGIVFGLTLLLMFRQSVVLRMAEEHYASLVAHASDVIMIVGTDGVVSFASPAAERVLGLKPDEIRGKLLAELWGSEDGARLRLFLDEIARNTSKIVGPVELRIERGARRYVVEGTGSNLSHDRAVRGLSLNFRDITERKALEEQLRQLAFHDPLTLLANRNLFRDRVLHALTLAQRGQGHVAVMFLDVDNFKDINDSLGHDAGDRLLQAVAQRILKTSRSSDTVARLGGDEFAVLLEGLQSLADAHRLADRLVETLGASIQLDGREVRVTVSIGVAFSAEDTTVETLLSNADLAMYHAKAAGKNRHALFQPQMQLLLHERLRLEADIGRALAREEFFLEYQPIIHLGTGNLLGVEALVRWRHPEAGVLMPARFIHILEECGQIAQLGRWVLKQACREMCDWRRSIAGGSGLRLAVNISAHHLEKGELVQDVLRGLEDSGFESSNLVIELTESTMMCHTEANLERFHRLKALGVKLAIDDFGTGYSSLSYLHRFPIDILKIDRSFVSRLTSSDDGPDLARAIITLGETLGLETVAEGIELEPQVATLLALGCVAGQGFLFARPSSLEQLSHTPWLAGGNPLAASRASRENPTAEECAAL